VDGQFVADVSLLGYQMLLTLATKMRCIEGSLRPYMSIVRLVKVRI
jgi:hypothetical protein